MKKIIAVIIVMIIAVSATGCREVKLAEDTKGETQISGKLECIDGDTVCSEWIDTETGVHYFYTTIG